MRTEIKKCLKKLSQFVASISQLKGTNKLILEHAGELRVIVLEIDKKKKKSYTVLIEAKIRHKNHTQHTPTPTK